MAANPLVVTVSRQIVRGKEDCEEVYDLAMGRYFFCLSLFFSGNENRLTPSIRLPVIYLLTCTDTFIKITE